MPVRIQLDLDGKAAESQLERFTGKVRDKWESVGQGVARGAEKLTARAQAGARAAERGFTKENIKSAASQSVVTAQQGLQRGAGTADRTTSGLDEFASGGFYGAVQDKLDAARELRDLAAQRSDKETHAAGGPGASGLPGPIAAGAAAANLPNEVDKLNVREAHIDAVRMRGGLAGGGMTAMPGASAGPQGDGAPLQKGGMLADGAKAFGLIVGVIGAAAGFMMKMVSGLGQRYTQAMMSQAGTMGATGGYVGGGGGYFQNSEVAQAAVGLARGRGESVYGRGGALAGELNSQGALAFAASQGMGLAQLAESLGEVQRGNRELSLSVLRGYGESSRFTTLRMGEYVTRLGQFSRDLREAGFTANIEQAAALGAALGERFSKTAGLDPERGLTLATQADQRARSADRGGAVGGAALSQALQKYGDLSAAMQAVERGEFTASSLEYLRRAAGGTGFGFLARDELGASFTEGSAMAAGAITPAGRRAGSAIRAGSLQPLATENLVSETFAGSTAAREASEIGNRAAIDVLKIFEQNQGKLLGVIQAMQDGEHALMNNVIAPLASGVGTMIEQMGEMIQKMQRLF